MSKKTLVIISVVAIVGLCILSLSLAPGLGWKNYAVAAFINIQVIILYEWVRWTMKNL